MTKEEEYWFKSLMDSSFAEALEESIEEDKRIIREKKEKGIK